MSLINEALKRTRDASFNAPPAAAATAPAYRLSHGAARAAWRPGPVIAGATIAVGLTAIVLTTVLSVRSYPVKPSRPLAMTITLPAGPASTVATPPSAPPQPSPAARAVKPEAKTAEDQLVARVLERVKSATPPPASAAPPPPPTPPKLRLQGITIDGNTSEAMINGSTVHVGETIEGAKITAITTSLVKLQFGSEEIVLRFR